MNTKCKITEFKGQEIFTIIEVNDEGVEVDSKYPVISFGKKKAQAILNHEEDIKLFCSDKSGKS